MVLQSAAMYAPWRGDVVRQSKPRFMSQPYRMTGAGSVIKGARWSVRGLMPTVYGSNNPATLAAEANYKGLKYGWTAADLKAQLMIGMHFELQSVVDLTAAATQQALGVTLNDTINCDWDAEQTAGREALTQAIARAAFEREAEGLIVPCARLTGGVNLVYYPTHRRTGSTIQTLNPTDIPFMHGL